VPWTPPNGTTRTGAGRLSNLAGAYQIRFGRLEDLDDLDRAVDLLWQAMDLTSDSDVNGAGRQSNLRRPAGPLRTHPASC
jgi:hypothetical protein